MEIRKSQLTDLDTLMKMYENARSFMSSHGNPTQWGNTYPPKPLVAKDIEEGCSYVCIEQDKESPRPSIIRKDETILM